MDELLLELQSFLPVQVYEERSDLELEPGVFYLFDKETKEQVGVYWVNDNGELENFSLDIEPILGQLSKRELIERAERFIHTFHPLKMKEIEFSAILDFDNPYLIIFEKRDELYGRFLPGTGFSIAISTNGFITNFTFFDEEYKVNYPKTMISKGEALEKYLNHLSLELVITQFDTEVFKNGDNQFHLAYNIVEQVFDIPADGSPPELIQETMEMESIPPRLVPKENFYQLIGITADYILLNVKSEEGKTIEMWSKQGLWTDDLLDDLETATPNMIKIWFDQESGTPIRILSGEPKDVETLEIDFIKAKRCALNLLFKIFPNAHEKFKMEIIEKEILYFSNTNEEQADDHYVFPNEEEGFNIEPFDFEETYTFIFQLVHDGIKVEHHVILIEIGKKSGLIHRLELNLPSDDFYTKIQSQPLISYEQALNIYKSQLEMELLFVQEYTNGEKVFHLSYGPSFPKTIGHVRMIDAVSGDAMYVNIGNATLID